jgi:recombination protein RecA
MLNEITDKARALKNALSSIEKAFGKGSIMNLGGQEHDEPVGVIPSGSVALDQALGVGGYPRGRVVEVFGPESSGKTTLTLHAIAEAQRAGGTAAFIDAEHAFDRAYAKGVAPAPWTWWSSTRWRPWCPRPRSRGTWGISTWASRRG